MGTKMAPFTIVHSAYSFVYSVNIAIVYVFRSVRMASTAEKRPIEKGAIFQTGQLNGCIFKRIHSIVFWNKSKEKRNLVFALWLLACVLCVFLRLEVCVCVFVMLSNENAIHHALTSKVMSICQHKSKAILLNILCYLWWMSVLYDT